MRLSETPVDRAIANAVIIIVFVFIAGLTFAQVPLESNSRLTSQFFDWLANNSDSETNLPRSHTGDERFLNWTLTYDSAVASLAWMADGQMDKARKIIDFYLDNENVWRLGGIIESVDVTSAVLGEDWSVRTGSNLWIGLAAFHLYKATQDKKYLDLAKKLADFGILLQVNDPKSLNYGGICLGPAGGQNVVGDQHLDYDVHRPSFTEIFATEHNMDAYALFNMLYIETQDPKYSEARSHVLHWLKTVAYNKQEHRFNRGYTHGLDSAVATDVQSWGISALGVKTLDTLEPNLAEKIIAFIEQHCIAEIVYKQPDGKTVMVRGVDFVDHDASTHLGRKPLVSPEWTFQLINAYRKMEQDCRQQKDSMCEQKYRTRREDLTKSILAMATPTEEGLAYPYASQPNALIGHEYRTPAAGSLSAIGAVYAVLALQGLDPLVAPEK